MTLRCRSLLLAVALLAGSSAHAAAWTVGATQAGPLRIGMSLPQVNRVLGEHLRQDDVPGPDPTGRCFQVGLPQMAGVGLMFIDGRLARVDVEAPDPRTARGVGVGDPEAAVARAYGERLRRSVAAYVDDGSTLTVLEAGGRYGIRFEIEGGKVARFCAGSASAIQFIEGCA